MCRAASGSSLDDGSTKAMHPDAFAAPALKGHEAVARDEARTAPFSDASGEDVEWGGRNINNSERLQAEERQPSQEKPDPVVVPVRRIVGVIGLGQR
jgi:hypothetical protein